MAQNVAIHSRDEVVSTFSRISVNPFLIFQKEFDTAFFSNTSQNFHTLDDFVAVDCWIISFWHVKAENPNPWGLVKLGNFQRDLISLQVRLERIGDFNLADRRTDCTQAKATLA